MPVASTLNARLPEIRIERELAVWIAKLAQSEQRTFAAMVRVLLREARTAREA